MNRCYRLERKSVPGWLLANWWGFWQNREERGHLRKGGEGKVSFIFDFAVPSEQESLLLACLGKLQLHCE